MRNATDRYSSDPAWAAEADARDPLREFRTRFHIPPGREGAPAVYFCGNSLGLQPKTTARFIAEELEDWARLGVEGHFHARHPWMPYHELLTAQTAGIVGAQPEEVVVMNSLTVNLHLMMVSFYRPTAARHKIIIEQRAFPSDQYAAASQLRFHGFDPDDALVEIPIGEDGRFTKDAAHETIDRHGDSAALLLLGGVNYYNGQLFDIAAITEHAHRAGVTVGVDCAHAAGNVPLQLHDWDVDFAAWCSYKYLNAGPGSTAGCFVHARHGNDASLPRFAGWWGQDKSSRFAMPSEFTPIPGAEGWQLSNQSILPLAALRASTEIFADAGMDALRAKSARLTGYLEFLLRAQPRDDWHIITPTDPAERGCQLSLRIDTNGRALFDYLAAHDAICDWREPDVIRVAPVPLYNSYTDAARFAALFHAYFRQT